MVKIIKKLQEGGSMPFMVYTPIQTGQPEPAKGSGNTTSDKKESGLSKDIFNKISENGLPSDVEAFNAQLSNFASGISEGSGIDSLMSTPEGYLMMLNQVAKLKTNKEAVTKATDELYKKKGLDEAALTANGRVMVSDEGGNITALTIEEYGKNRDKLHVITNNELLQMRTYSPNAANNSQMISILQNGEGMDNVTDQLRKVIGDMKTNKEKKEQFIPVEQLEALKGINAIEGVAKVTTDVETNAQYKDYAKKYLWMTLPPSSRNLLRFKAAQLGKDPNEGALEIIESLIIPSTSTTSSIAYDTKDAKIGTASGGSGSSGSMDRLTFQTQYVANEFQKEMTPHVFNLGDNYSIIAPSQKVGAMLDAKNQEVIPPNSSIGTVIDRVFNTIADKNSVFFGDQKIEYDKFDRLATTTGEMEKAYLPLDQEALAVGIYKPDLEVAKKFKEAEKMIKPNMSEHEKMLIYKYAGILDYVSTIKVPGRPDTVGLNISDKTKVAPFAMVQAIGQHAGLIENPDSPMLQHIEDTDDVRRILNKAKFGSDYKEGKTDYLRGSFVGNMPFTDTEEIYKGYVFIHTYDNMSAAAASSSALKIPEKQNTLTNVRSNEQQQEHIQRIKNSSSSNLLNQ